MVAGCLPTVMKADPVPYLTSAAFSDDFVSSHQQVSCRTSERTCADAPAAGSSTGIVALVKPCAKTWLVNAESGRVDHQKASHVVCSLHVLNMHDLARCSIEMARGPETTLSSRSPRMEVPCRRPSSSRMQSATAVRLPWQRTLFRHGPAAADVALSPIGMHPTTRSGCANSDMSAIVVAQSLRHGKACSSHFLRRLTVRPSWESCGQQTGGDIESVVLQSH